MLLAFTVDRLSYLLWDYLLRGCGKIDGKHVVPAGDRVKATLARSSPHYFW